MGVPYTSRPYSWTALPFFGWSGYRVCLTIVHGERRLSEPLRKSPSLNSVSEKWSRNLVECSAQHIISQAFGRWVPVYVVMMVVLIIQERLTRRSPWSGSITTLLLIVRREVRIWGSLPSPFVAQLPLQIINLHLHVPCIFLMRDMTLTSRMASTSMGGMYTSFLVPSTLKIDEMILRLGPRGFLSVWTWTYHN